jgi:hypothetical protein
MLSFQEIRQSQKPKWLSLSLPCLRRDISPLSKNYFINTRNNSGCLFFVLSLSLFVRMRNTTFGCSSGNAMRRLDMSGSSHKSIFWNCRRKLKTFHSWLGHWRTHPLTVNSEAASENPEKHRVFDHSFFCKSCQGLAIQYLFKKWMPKYALVPVFLKKLSAVSTILCLWNRAELQILNRN